MTPAKATAESLVNNGLRIFKASFSLSGGSGVPKVVSPHPTVYCRVKAFCEPPVIVEAFGCHLFPSFRKSLAFFGALLHGAKRHSIDPFVTLCAQKPECQPTGVMVCSGRCRAFRYVGTNSQRALLARLSPAALLHDDANHHTTFGQMVSSRTAAGNARSEAYLGLALGTAYVVVQFERFANGYLYQGR